VAAVSAAAMASPQKQPMSQHLAAPSDVSYVNVDVPTLSPVVAAAGRQSSDRVPAHVPVEYHAVGPDGKRVACDWL
jgi:hypothetical protein